MATVTKCDSCKAMDDGGLRTVTVHKGIVMPHYAPLSGGMVRLDMTVDLCDRCLERIGLAIHNVMMEGTKR